MLLLIVFVFLGSAMSQCPRQWTQFRGNCYLAQQVNPLRVTWSTARSICQAMDADLASIYSEEENQFLTNLSQPINSCHVVWIGLQMTRFSYSGTYQWSDQSNVYYKNVGSPGVAKKEVFWLHPSCYGCELRSQWHSTNLIDTAHSFICKRNAVRTNNPYTTTIDYYDFLRTATVEYPTFDSMTTTV